MQRVFGTLADGVQVHALRLRGDGDLEAEVLTYGGILHALELTTPQGRVPLVLTLPDLPAYAADNDSLNILVGRFGNRIAGARYTLDGVTHVLAANEGRNQLHGGCMASGGACGRCWSRRRTGWCSATPRPMAKKATPAPCRYARSCRCRAIACTWISKRSAMPPRR